MTTPTLDLVDLAARRLNIARPVAAEIAARNVATCEAIVAHLHDEWEAAETGSCCKPVITHADEWHVACEHLRRLWDARSYLALARAGAPTSGAFPCTCNGSGKFYSGGAVVNGTYTGTIGQCFRCAGKGWQSEADRKRNAYYDNHVRRISF
jgi:hypothetical protein